MSITVERDEKGCSPQITTCLPLVPFETFPTPFIFPRFRACQQVFSVPPIPRGDRLDTLFIREHADGGFADNFGQHVTGVLRIDAIFSFNIEQVMGTAPQ